MRQRDGQAWITRDEKNLILLPQQHCPGQDGPCTVQVGCQRVIIGCESGQVLIFGFEEEEGKAFSLSRTSPLN